MDAPMTRRGVLAAAVAPAVAIQDDSRPVMMRFCSLGGNCEFGLAQRAFGAEPADIFRWASVFPAALIGMLHARFAEVGNPAMLRLESGGTGREYMVRNVQYKFIWHAGVKDGQEAPADILRRESIRLPRLAEKLMDELRDGSRIFVRAPAHGSPPEQLPQLLAALAEYGKPLLFFVTLPEDGAAPLSVHRASDTLIRGYIDRFAQAGNLPGTVPGQSWLTLCREVLPLMA